MRLTDYGRRLGLAVTGPPTLATLRALHLAHVVAIPFENLDVQMGVRIRLDIESVQAKLVDRRRGGYCFEQNTLFLNVLRELGFDVLPCEARVRNGPSSLLARTHMMLIVRVDGRDWLCDVGFGTGLFEPAPMDGEPVSQFAWTFRVAREDALGVLQAHRHGAWEDLYAFEPAGRLPVDFEMANWYTSTWPESRFIQTLTAQRSSPDVRRVLRNFIYTEDRGGGDVTTRTISRDALMPMLRDTFDLDVPDEATFVAID